MYMRNVLIELCKRVWGLETTSLPAAYKAHFLELLNRSDLVDDHKLTITTAAEAVELVNILRVNSSLSLQQVVQGIVASPPKWIAAPTDTKTIEKAIDFASGVWLSVTPHLQMHDIGLVQDIQSVLGEIPGQRQSLKLEYLSHFSAKSLTQIRGFSLV